MNKENKTLYEYLSEYRSELMGLAILWVVWYHSSLELDVFPSETINNILIFIRGRGYGGVDIFLLLSGMGLYNSLNRNSVAKYLKNRLKRILPTWWILYLVTAVLEFKLLDIRYSAKELLGGITLTGFLTQLPNQGNWYVSFIMVIYLIAPVLYFLFHESKNKRATCIILVAITLLISVTFWGDDGRLTGMTRLPIFVFGMYLSADRDKIKVNRTTIIVLSALMAIGIALLRVCQGIDWDTRWHYGLWWYPFILVTPGLAMLLALLISKTSGIFKLLVYCLDDI